MANTNKTTYEEEIDNRLIGLQDGEVICPKCEGVGHRWGFPCDRCWGFKKLDWIELVMGKEAPFEESGRSASSSRSSTASVTVRTTNVTVKPPNATKRRNANGSNSKPRLGAIQRFLEMLNKSQGGLQRRRHTIRSCQTKK